MDQTAHTSTEHQWKLLWSMHERLASIEAKLDIAVSADTDKEVRLRSLEKQRWMTHGIAATVALIAGAVAAHWRDFISS